MSDIKKKWVNIRIPVDSKIYEVIENDGNRPAWKALEKFAEQIPDTREEKATELFNKFVSDIELLYPGKSWKVANLSSLILRQMLQEIQKNSDEYFDALKEL